MEIQAQTMPSKPRREPWNKGKLIGQKPPLRAKHVWSIRTRLQMDGRTRGLAMFNLAITASCGAAMSSLFGSRTLHRAAMQSIAPQCGRRRPGDSSGLN
jgi:hypothetical protein